MLENFGRNGKITKIPLVVCQNFLIFYFFCRVILKVKRHYCPKFQGNQTSFDWETCIKNLLVLGEDFSQTTTVC